MKKRYFSVFLALLLFVCSLIVISKLTMPKYASTSREGNLISEYYAEVKNGNTHDVIFVGDCEAYSSFVPPVLWEKYGITSFVRGSPSQTLAQSHALISEMLHYEKPRAIVLSVYALCKDESAKEAYNRMTLDGMRFSFFKLIAIRDSIGHEESFLSYLIPVLRFHSRWSELGTEDLKYIFSRPRVSHNGYFMQKGVIGASDEWNALDVAAPPLPSENFERLEMIERECRKFGVELILVKTPISSWRYPWYEEWDDEINSFAIEHGIIYYNLLNDADRIGLDIRCDSYDGGIHLNVSGAEKVTTFFGDILSNKHEIEENRDVRTSRIWEKKVKDYYEERN